MMLTYYTLYLDAVHLQHTYNLMKALNSVGVLYRSQVKIINLTFFISNSYSLNSLISRKINLMKMSALVLSFYICFNSVSINNLLN